MHIHANTIVFVALAFFATGAAEAQVYKCKTADGKIIYQQIACSKKDNETGQRIKIWAQPSEADVAAAQTRAQQQNISNSRNERRQASANANHADTQGHADASSPDRTAYEPPASSNACPPGQIPLNASRSDASQGWSRSKGYVPLRCGTPGGPQNNRVTQTGPGITEPRRIQDQYGNFYNQPPGSTIVTDEKSGKQCFLNGVVVRCN